MSRRNRNRTPAEFELDIVDLSHDGRGVARREDGKTVFVSGALPGERVRARQTGRNRSFDEAATLDVLQPSPDRIAPRCPHFGVCSGCVLQHLDATKQIEAKQRTLLENFERIGHVRPQTVLPPLTAQPWGYRRKGRFSVRWVEKKGKALVGFRELDPRFVADLVECHTVVPEVGALIAPLSELVASLDARREIPQIEFVVGDAAAALTVRHLVPLSDADRAALAAFGEARGFAVYLQPKGPDSVVPLWPADGVALDFAVDDSDLRLAFKPLDFIQVNGGLNRAMIARTLELLAPRPTDRVLDLFCGLGNFTLPLARRAGQVVGVEGDAALVRHARENAQANGLGNAEFHAADLTQDLRGEPWMRAGFDILLLDPPRSGADAVLAQLPLDGLRRIVYVSCHPGSLARDAGYLVNERGWRLVAAGVMDMFPHTAHVESIAVFER
ncbi:23S rRNA (uracil(1939)-C(5))-methyltransferase RlmD [Coralloluteibacterium thermophilus]|uniref:23S rRNA (uracil(1939)-C(5))-methyltransferase RlmD n=1 Tax=Coralloluteibacterium thermophilum TaxID=2707049 RepID=A0ABV9NJM0_9GAMM